jgi:hypothetical protein
MATNLRIARVALHSKVYEDIATKFFEHFLHIVEAMNNIGSEGIGLWNEEDQFYYDVLNLPDGRMVPSGCGRWSVLSRSLPLRCSTVTVDELPQSWNASNGSSLLSRPGESRPRWNELRHESSHSLLARPSHECLLMDAG